MTMIMHCSWDGDGTTNANYVGGGLFTNIAGGSITTSSGFTGNVWTGNSEFRRSLSATEEDDLLVVGTRYKDTAITSRTVLIFRSDANVTTHLTVMTKADGAIEIRRGTAAGTIIATTTATNLFPSGTVHYLEVKARLSDSTSDLVVYVDGVSRALTPAGPYDTKNAGTKTVFDSVAWNGDNNGGTFHKDMYVLNEQGTVNNAALNDVTLAIIRPNGDGTTSQGTNSAGTSVNNSTYVDETTHDDTDYVGITTNDNKDTYAYGNLSFGSGTIADCQVVSRALKTDTGAKSIAAVVRTSATETDGATLSLSTVVQPYKETYETKPGGGAFSISDVNGSEFGFKAKA